METVPARQIARWLALGALFLIPFTPLVVSSSFFFPFITGKAFFFRIMVEAAVAGWAVLALLDKRYRPHFSVIGAAVLLFVLWMAVADGAALNASKAFWSNFERMEGWVLLVHLLGFFLAAGAVLRVEQKWRAWFLTSLAVSLFVSAYSLLQLGGAFTIHQGSTRIDATFGNSAYLAIYFLFNVFLALWLGLTEKQVWLRRSLFVLAGLEGVLIFFTETRGTALALVFALAVAALLSAITTSARLRRLSIAALIIIVAVAGAFYMARNSAFIQGNHVLQRVASISATDGSTRFTIWGMALQGAKEHPILGWGQEGFNYVFNRYYTPTLHGQEPWFDRAHNAFIDWLSAGGFPALLLYLSLFVSALYLLWRHSDLPRSERIALTAALAGYAVHNMFVFDNLYSYVYFFAILAFIDAQVARPIARFERMPEMQAVSAGTLAIPIATVVLIGVMWFVNVPGMTVASRLITALSSQPHDALAVFSDLAAHPAFAAQEVREQLVSFAGGLGNSANQQDRQAAVTLAITEMQKQVARYPQDAREHLELAYAYRFAGDSADSMKEIQAAIALSPKNEKFWIEAGITAWDAGDVEAARKAFTTAYELAPQFSDMAVYAAAGDFAVGDTAAADKVLMTSYGTTTIDSDVLAVVYYRTKNWSRLIDLWKLRVSAPTADARTWFGLASAYYTAGQKGDALATIRELVKRFPDAAASGAAAIQEIQSGAK